MSVLAQRVLAWFVAPVTDEGPRAGDATLRPRPSPTSDRRGGLGPPRRRARHRPAPAAARAETAAPAVVVLGGVDVAVFATALAAALARTWRSSAAIVCCARAIATPRFDAVSPITSGPAGTHPAAAPLDPGAAIVIASAPAAVLSTPAARRLACALLDRGHAASVAGRVVRVALHGDEVAAAAEHARVAAAGRGAPVVLALSGPRGEAFEPVLATHDLVVLATAPGADPRIAELARAALAARLPTVPTLALAVPRSPLAARRPRAAIAAVLEALR